MFKHLLLSTDGSLLSSGMIGKCIALAKDTGAQVTGLHVLRDIAQLTGGDALPPQISISLRSQDVARGRNFLAAIEQAAREAGVPCNTLLAEGEEPYAAIVKTAQERGCDVICMAAHGRHGPQGLLLGSETQKVLIHSRVPVLVYR